jgi:predicted RNA-binding protein YlxR (DUF448 family)
VSHIPVRNCAACRARLPKGELIRIVRTPDGSVRLDPTGKVDGRGLYWCGKRSCLGKLQKKGLVGRLIKAKPSESLFDELKGVIVGD